jgi:hypothetical protein
MTVSAPLKRCPGWLEDERASRFLFVASGAPDFTGWLQTVGRPCVYAVVRKTAWEYYQIKELNRSASTHTSLANSQVYALDLDLFEARRQFRHSYRDPWKVDNTRTHSIAAPDSQRCRSRRAPSRYKEVAIARRLDTPLTCQSLHFASRILTVRRARPLMGTFGSQW